MSLPPRTRRQRLLRYAPMLTLVWLAVGCGKPFRVTERLTLTAAVPSETLEVHNGKGHVILSANNAADRVTAEVTKTGKGTTQAEAEKVLADITLTLEPDPDDPDVLLARAKYPRRSFTRDYSVDWVFTAPPGIAIDVETDFGDVEARGFVRGARLHSDFGNVQADLAGPVDINTDFGDVELKLQADTPSDVTVHTDFGDATIHLPEARKGRLAATTDFGDVQADLEGTSVALLRHRSSSIEADLGESAEPPINISTEFGDVIVKTYRP